MSRAGELNVRAALDPLIEGVDTGLHQYAEVVVVPVIGDFQKAVGLDILSVAILKEIASHVFVGFVFQYADGTEFILRVTVVPLGEVTFAGNGQAAGIG